jgi:drug/metabolite transporter (DMT)-like permease
MSDHLAAAPARSTISLHKLGVICALSAAVWLGSAEAPTKLVTEGFSPFLISMGMVMGAFVARWTLPTLLKGTGFVLDDLFDKPHLMVWAVLAGMLWAVANTLTIFAVRDVGLSIAFPLWNTNSLVGLMWGCLLFKELRGSRARDWAKVLGGAAAIVFGAGVLAVATAERASGSSGKATIGIVAALSAGVLLGTMYIPYRKAYISGMNPLSFVTVFTFGELGTILALGWIFYGGGTHLASALNNARPMLFWPFLGGFCWVIGDLFQQYAAKYIGIGRGIPLSNTNQLWGLAWGALVFGEFTGLTFSGRLLIVAGIEHYDRRRDRHQPGSAVSFGNGKLARRNESRVSPLWPGLRASGRRRRGRRPLGRPSPPAPLVGDPDRLRSVRHLRLAGSRHAHPAHGRQHSLDDGPHRGHVDPSRQHRNTALAPDSFFLATYAYPGKVFENRLHLKFGNLAYTLARSAQFQPSPFISNNPRRILSGLLLRKLS